MKFKDILAAAGLSAAVFASAQSAQASNLALSADGASFVSGSSAIAQGEYGLTFNYANMQANLLSDAKSPSVSNGDTRYIFADGDSSESLVVKLGALSSLSSFGATDPADRQPSSLSVLVSTDGVSFTSVGPAVGFAGGGAALIALTAPVTAQYVEYAFGGSGGVGVSQVYANGVSAVPEPAGWALMLMGVGLVGAAMRHNRRAGAALAA